MLFLKGAGEYAEIPPAVSVWTARGGMFGSGLGDRHRMPVILVVAVFGCSTWASTAKTAWL